ncbi:MAG: tripartite tricarboxylate transporter TctB family protein [Candidatus Rokubacteria bacterium]|nr:tripartite tricarboxylate transporter TctB family protein [Candidatus Rokubacteria bacterium]
MAVRDRLTAVILIVFTLAVIWQARRIPLGTLALPGPGFLPVAAATLLGVLALALLVDTAVRRADESAGGGAGAARTPVFVMVALVLYALVLERVGYLAATGPLLALLLVLHRQRWPVIVGVTLVATLGSWWLFAVWLEVPLPRGTFWR